MLASAAQHEPAICMHTSPPSGAPLPPAHLTFLGLLRALAELALLSSSFPSNCCTHDSVYISILLSQFVPFSSSPAVIVLCCHQC